MPYTVLLNVSKDGRRGDSEVAAAAAAADDDDCPRDNHWLAVSMQANKSGGHDCRKFSFASKKEFARENAARGCRCKSAIACAKDLSCCKI